MPADPTAHPDGYDDDLRDFVRFGKLDAYELTDEELARLLEVWRWANWKRANMPTAPDHDVIAAARALQQRLAREHDVEVEYNTILLLKQEIESLMHLRVLAAVPGVLRYFLRPRGLLRLVEAIRHVRRYRKIDPVAADEGTHLYLYMPNEGRGARQRLRYPRALLDSFRGRAPDILKRRYWRQLSGQSFEERKRTDQWW